MARFDGQTVLVTGASRGIGLASAERFSQLGARVGLVARDASLLASAASAIAGETHTVAADLTDPAECVRGSMRSGRRSVALGPIDVACELRGQPPPRLHVRTSPAE